MTKITTTSNPPRPRLTLRIGVTGHRPNKLQPGAEARLRTSVRDLLRIVSDTLAKVHQENPSVFSPEHPRLAIVSPLAAGTDCIIADVGQSLGMDLYAPLPFPRGTYLDDFTNDPWLETHLRLREEATAIFELDGTRDDSPVAYERVGLFMLRQSDLVIDVWNGKLGDRGGTHDIVQAAVNAGVPLLHFDPAGNGPSMLLGESEKSQDARALVAMARPASPHEIANLVRQLVEPPAADGISQETQGNPAQATQLHTTGETRLSHFYAEREYRRNNWLAYPLLLKILVGRKGVRKSRRPTPYQESASLDWKRDFWTPLDKACTEGAAIAVSLKDNIAQTLQPRFAWADGLAVHYGQAYRSSYVSVALLAALAVFFAVLPLPAKLILKSSYPEAYNTQSLEHWIELLASTLALGSIVAVSILVAWARRERLHEKWIDYRQLAERLRFLRILALTGSPTPELRMPHREESLRTRQSWVHWYIRATSREIGMPQGPGCQNYAGLVKRTLLEAELKGQEKYHKSAADRERRIANVLERFGTALFSASAIMTILAIIFFLYAIISHNPIQPYDKWVADLTMFIVAVCPALGAALFALRSYGDYERNAQVSDVTRERLATIMARLKVNNVDFDTISRETDHAAAMLAGEVSDWRMVFRGKPLTLPG